MEAPLVSIIIPVFNRAVQIKKALDSVLAQTYTTWECLVVDDGSTDCSVEVINAYQEQDNRVRVFQRARLPKGAPTCRNIGLEQAQGTYVIYLDSDDYLLPFCLKQRLEAFNNHEDCDFLVFPMGVEKYNTVVKQKIPDSADYLLNFLSADLPWQTMCPIWQRTFLNSLHGFTEGYPRFNDPELMIRALVSPKVSYKVFNDYDYDTVFLPSPKDSKLFTDRVFNSLKLFIPDISYVLEVNGKGHLKVYLSLYLHLWFKYFYVPLGISDMKQSLRLLGLFKTHNIINSKQLISLISRLLVYTVSNIVFLKPINKLTEKRLYL